MQSNKRSLARLTVSAALAAFALAACGGGGSGGPETINPPYPMTTGGAGTGGTMPAGPLTQAPTQAPAPEAPAPVELAPVAPVSEVTASCDNCAAVNSNTYSGAGVGVWERQNTTGADLDVPVGIAGLSGQDVTLVITNERATDVAFPAIVTKSSFSGFAGQALASNVAAPTAARSQITEFNRTGWMRSVQQSRLNRTFSRLRMAPVRAAWVPGDLRSFNDTNDVARTTVLGEQVLASDGTTVNVWVEQSEYDPAKVTVAMAQELAQAFAQPGGVYDMLKAVGGPLWGAHSYPDELIAGDGQPIDIVVLNFDKNSAPYGMLGYFHALNNVKATVEPTSNESVSLYMDAETLYLDGAKGRKTIISTLAHEGMHMSNFYRRGVKMAAEYMFELWLEEMSAMMMEDLVSAQLSADFSMMREARLTQYLQLAGYNCALKSFESSASCEAYATSGSLGGFLLRQLGVGFYQNLLASGVMDSEAALDGAIKATRADSGLAHQLRRFGASTIGAMPSNAPAGFGFPARVENGFTLQAIDLTQLTRNMPTASPANLRGYGHFAVKRTAVTGTFAETVRVPPGATLSVVIH